jgi:hypothetical protein
MEFHELTNVHVYEDGYVRGLPREAQADLRSVALAWDGHAERRWCSFVGVAADLVAELQMLGCSARTHEGSPGPYRQPVTMMTPEEAESATGEMRGLYGIIETRVIRLTHLATEFVKRRGWVALGYETLDEYSAERLPFRLPREARKEIVMQLVADGISMRAAAAITRSSERTVRRDLSSSAANAAVGVTADPQLMRVGQDGRDRPARRTYEPVEPTQVWTPTPEPDSMVAEEFAVEHPVAPVTVLSPRGDSRVEAVLTGFADDNITSTESRIALLRGACDAWLDRQGWQASR